MTPFQRNRRSRVRAVPTPAEIELSESARHRALASERRVEAAQARLADTRVRLCAAERALHREHVESGDSASSAYDRVSAAERVVVWRADVQTAEMEAEAAGRAAAAARHEWAVADFTPWVEDLRWEETQQRNEKAVALEAAARWLGVIELLVPARLRQEEIGDALEVIQRVAADGQPRWPWRVAVKVASTAFWVLVNAVREMAAGLLGRKSA